MRSPLNLLFSIPDHFPFLNLSEFLRDYDMETRNKNPVFVSLASFIFLLYSFPQFCYAANDTIKQGESIWDGGSLVSGNNVFELGFFSPGNSMLRYVGIWYKFDSEAVVWVANRNKPISGRNGVLRIEDDGKLVVRDGNNSLVWSSNVSGSSNDTAAKLLNNGNFVLSRDDSIGDTSRALWQSFDEPTDTFLPGMKVPVSSKIGEYQPYRSWKSPDDPSPGNYSLGVDPNGGQQIVMWDLNKGRRRWRSGQWNQQFFTGVPFMRNNATTLHGFDISQPDENGTMYITYTASTPDIFRFQISWEGREKQSRWDASKKKWDYLQSEPDPANECELYNFCGNYSTCDRLDRRRCICLEGFRPKSQAQWNARNWSGGCVRKIDLQCPITNGTAVGKAKPDIFKKSKCTKLPDLATLLPSEGDVDACNKRCSENCLCIAYAFIPGIRCMIWTEDLVDMQYFHQGGSLDFFYRLHHSESDRGRKISNLEIVIISLVVTSFLVASLWLLWRFRTKLNGLSVVSSKPCCKDDDVAVFDVSKGKSKEFSTDLSGPADILIDGNQVHAPELQNFDFSCIVTATNNFCEGNRLGQGGFGSVYKGELPGGEQIAVKRLAGHSGQGLEEFKTEIILIAKLQHRNLVGNWFQAWRLWSEDKVTDLVDPCIRDSCSPNEVLKCIQIGMLCVQDSPAHRPKMDAVVVFLESETATLPNPTKPTYTSLKTAVEEEYVLDGQEIVSSNDVTVTTIVGR
ncbi:hypothetical protein V6N13_078272 [Hibiscus sabdariffa]